MKNTAKALQLAEQLLAKYDNEHDLLKDLDTAKKHLELADKAFSDLEKQPITPYHKHDLTKLKTKLKNLMLEIEVYEKDLKK